MLRQDNTMLSIGVMLIAMMMVSFADALVKKYGAHFTLWQIFVLRSLISLPVLIILIKGWQRSTSLFPQNMVANLVRNALLLCAWSAYYVSIQVVPLSIAAAVFYTLPLFVNLFSWLFLDDRINYKNWIAFAIGFIGVLLVIQPNSSDFSYYALLPLFSSIVYAVVIIITRSYCRQENPAVLTVYLNIFYIIVGGLASILLPLIDWSPTVISEHHFILGQWSEVTLMLVGVLAVMAIIGSIGQIGETFAYQIGHPAIVVTIDFTYIIFAIIWGILLFSSKPDWITIIGIVAITVGGVVAILSKESDQ